LGTGGSQVVKVGMSVVEIIPLVGAAVGSVGNASILYSLGHVACSFYEAKRRSLVKQV
jgi:uncharacterized protein (DUF697 family)